MEVQNIKTALA